MTNILNFMIFYYILDIFLILLIFVPSNLYKFHPLIYSMILFFYMIILSLKLNYMLMNYFYSYILFLFMVGGVMILIMYFTSISGNELILYSINYLKFFFLKLIMIMMMMIMIFYIIYLNNWIDMFSKFDLMNFNKIYDDNYNFFNLKNLYMGMNMEITIFFFMYLLFVMLFTTLICMKFKIPMRQMIN